MIKLIARRGRSWNLLLTNEEERLGRVYNSADDELFEEHFFDSILARGYWEAPTKQEIELFEPTLQRLRKRLREEKG